MNFSFDTPLPADTNLTSIVAPSNSTQIPTIGYDRPCPTVPGRPHLNFFCDSIPHDEPAAAASPLSSSSPPLPERKLPNSAQSETRLPSLKFSFCAADGGHSQPTTTHPSVAAARPTAPSVIQSPRLSSSGAEDDWEVWDRDSLDFPSQIGFNPWSDTKGSMDDNHGLSNFRFDARGPTPFVCT